MGKITYLTPIIRKQQKPSDQIQNKNNPPICIELYQKPRLVNDSDHNLLKEIEKLIESSIRYK